MSFFLQVDEKHEKQKEKNCGYSKKHYWDKKEEKPHLETLEYIFSLVEPNNKKRFEVVRRMVWMLKKNTEPKPEDDISPILIDWIVAIIKKIKGYKKFGTVAELLEALEKVSLKNLHISNDFSDLFPGDERCCNKI